MNSELKITLVQSNLIWQDKKANLEQLGALLESTNEKTDIIVLPEMFNTGFSMESEKLAETMNGLTVNWLKKQASKLNSVVVGSLIIEDEGNYYNRLLFVYPDGNFNQYNKRHLFRMAGEHNHYTSGNSKIIIEYKDWKICPLICYDLRFPVWSRNQEDFDMLIYIANWPERRSFAWKTLLLARAIENQVYVAGVNRIGDDANNIYHSGDSMLIDAKGNSICQFKAGEEGIKTSTVSLDELNQFRHDFPVGMDKDNFQLL